MKNSIFVLAVSAIGLFATTNLNAQTTDSTKTDSTTTDSTTSTSDTSKSMVKGKVVGGAEMVPTKDVVDNLSLSQEHTTLVSAVKAAGLVETLKGAGPYTVFAPSNAAFQKLPAGTVETLLKPENKAKLTKVLTYHVVQGKMSAQDIAKQIKAGNGKATLTTVAGEPLTASINAENYLVITDANGGESLITGFDVEQSNGIVQLVNAVLLPKQ